MHNGWIMGILAVHGNQLQPRCKVKVTEGMQNSYGTMHGGCTVPLVQATNQAPVARIARWLFQLVSSGFYFHPYLGKWSNLTNVFQMLKPPTRLGCIMYPVLGGYSIQKRFVNHGIKMKINYQPTSVGVSGFEKYEGFFRLWCHPQRQTCGKLATSNWWVVSHCGKTCTSCFSKHMKRTLMFFFRMMFQWMAGLTVIQSYRCAA